MLQLSPLILQLNSFIKPSLSHLLWTIRNISLPLMRSPFQLFHLKIHKTDALSAFSCLHLRKVCGIWTQWDSSSYPQNMFFGADTHSTQALPYCLSTSIFSSLFAGSTPKSRKYDHRNPSSYRPIACFSYVSEFQEIFCRKFHSIYQLFILFRIVSTNLGDFWSFSQPFSFKLSLLPRKY